MSNPGENVTPEPTMSDLFNYLRKNDEKLSALTTEISDQRNMITTELSAQKNLIAAQTEQTSLVNFRLDELQALRSKQSSKQNTPVLSKTPSEVSLSDIMLPETQGKPFPKIDAPIIASESEDSKSKTASTTAAAQRLSSNVEQRVSLLSKGRQSVLKKIKNKRDSLLEKQQTVSKKLTQDFEKVSSKNNNNNSNNNNRNNNNNNNHNNNNNSNNGRMTLLTRLTKLWSIMHLLLFRD